MRKTGFVLFSVLFCASLVPGDACAQGNFGAEMSGVNEILVNYVQFDDPKMSELCGLTRDGIAAVLKAAFAGTSVPAVSAAEAKMPLPGIARIKLETTISSYMDETMGCVSWVSMSAEGRAVVTIPPVAMPRDETILYWRHHLKSYSGQASHPGHIADALRKMVDKFAQQYKIDQPSAVLK